MHTLHHVVGRVLLRLRSPASSRRPCTRRPAPRSRSTTPASWPKPDLEPGWHRVLRQHRQRNDPRAAPGAAQAEPWILASTAGLSNVLGLLADDKRNTLWVCQNNTGGRGGPEVGQTALRSFDLKSGAAKGTYPFPSNGGVCNDMAIAPTARSTRPSRSPIGSIASSRATHSTSGSRRIRNWPVSTALPFWPMARST